MFHRTNLTWTTAALLWALGFSTALAAGTSSVRTEQVRAELVAHAPEGVAAGKPLWLGLRIEHQPHWHTYWKNPGDSGLATTLTWALPPGFAAGEIAWPTPRQLPVGPLMNFGYEGTLLLPVPITVPAGFQGTTLPVRLEAQWLVCKDVCIPESGDFALELPVKAATVAHAALFDAARAAAPRSLGGVQSQARVENNALQVRVQGLPAAWQGQALKFFPETAGVIDNAARPAASWQGAEWVAAVPLSAQRSESPVLMPAVLTRSSQAPLTRSLRLKDLSWNDMPAAWAAIMSPVSVNTSSRLSQMIRSLRSTTLASISRCCGMVEPMETTVARGLSQDPKRIGFSPWERAAASTMSAPSTAASPLATARAGTPRSRVSASAKAARRSGVGLCTTTSINCRTAAKALTWWDASRPLPSTAKRAGDFGARPSSASADVAAVRKAVIAFASRKAAIRLVSRSNNTITYSMPAETP